MRYFTHKVHQKILDPKSPVTNFKPRKGLCTLLLLNKPGPLGILDLQELEPCTVALRQSSLYDPPHYVSIVCRVALASTDQINTTYIWVQFSRNQLEVENQLQQRAEINKNSNFANHRNTKMFKSNKINQVYFQIDVEQFQFCVVNKCIIVQCRSNF